MALLFKEAMQTLLKAKNKANLFATIGPNSSGGIVLSGHTDVVPVTNQKWDSDPFQLIEKDGVGEVPNHIKDANRDAVALGHGQGYKYSHAGPGHFIPQQYLPQKVLGTYFYRPSDQGYETEVSERLERWRVAQRKALGIDKAETLPELTEDTITNIKRKHK